MGVRPLPCQQGKRTTSVVGVVVVEVEAVQTTEGGRQNQEWPRCLVRKYLLLRVINKSKDQRQGLNKKRIRTNCGHCSVAELGDVDRSPDNFFEI